MLFNTANLENDMFNIMVLCFITTLNFCRIYFQVDYISGLRDMLAPYFEVKSEISPKGGT